MKLIIILLLTIFTANALASDCQESLINDKNTDVKDFELTQEKARRLYDLFSKEEFTQEEQKEFDNFIKNISKGLTIDIQVALSLFDHLKHTSQRINGSVIQVALNYLQKEKKAILLPWKQKKNIKKSESEQKRVKELRNLTRKKEILTPEEVEQFISLIAVNSETDQLLEYRSQFNDHLKPLVKKIEALLNKEEVSSAQILIEINRRKAEDSLVKRIQKMGDLDQLIPLFKILVTTHDPFFKLPFDDLNLKGLNSRENGKDATMSDILYLIYEERDIMSGIYAIDHYFRMHKNILKFLRVTIIRQLPHPSSKEQQQ